MLNTRPQTTHRLKAFPFMTDHLTKKKKKKISDTDSRVGNLGYRAEKLGEEHFQHFINYIPVMTRSQEK